MKENKYRLAWQLITIHTFLIVVVFILPFFHWENPDSSIAFILMVLVCYFVDFPLGILFEKLIRPIRPDNFQLWMVISFSWFAFLGALYWFCISVIFNKIQKRRSINEHIS